MIDKIKILEKKLKSKFYFDYEIYKHTWFKAGGKTKVFCVLENEKELEIILNNISDLKYYIIGAGSNLLIRDKGYNGIIFKFGKHFNKIVLNDNSLDVGAGILDLNLSKFALINSIKNFEFYTGIPGTVGGAIKMNAGCYGDETANILNSATIIKSNGKKSIITKDNLKLFYRSSILKDEDIVIAANYILEYGDKKNIEEKMVKIKSTREHTQPLRSKTSGSSFKNPKGNYAAKLIDNAGCKGLNNGDAYVSTKHSNFLINTHNATATQIESLGEKIIELVFRKFQIKLEWEIKILGEK